jgi:hypothetical protein
VGESVWPDKHESPVPCAALTRVEGETFVPSVPLVCGSNITIE